LCGLSSGKQDMRYVRWKDNTFGMKFTFGGYWLKIISVRKLFLRR